MPAVRSKPKKKIANAVSTRQAVFGSPRMRPILFGVVLALVTLALYYPVIHHPFVNYDDDGYVTDNAHIRYGLDADGIKWAFTTFHQANWHPVTWLSHELDFQMFELDPAGHHATNLLLHAVNVFLLFWILWQATGYSGRSLMVAALFSLHPINVESVAWIAERKTVLSMLFFLLALGAYRWYAREPRVSRYLVVALLFALGLMAKPQVITLPFVLLLWDYWPLQRMFAEDKSTTLVGTMAADIPAKDFSWLLLEKLPLLGLSAISAFITVKAQRAGGAMGVVTRQPFSIRLENAVLSYGRYLGKAFWPVHLAPMYPHPGSSLQIWQVAASLLLLLAVTAVVITERRRRYLFVGWFWFLGTLVPMIGLVQVGGQAMADRYAYLPFVGLFIMLCWSVAEWAGQRGLSTQRLVGPAVVVLLALAVLTYRQIGFWSDNLTLWSYTLQVTTGNYEAEDGLGGALMSLRQPEEAIKHFRAAVAINSSDPIGNLQLAMYDQRNGRLPQAIEQYNKLVNLTQNAVQGAELFSNLGFAYGALGDFASARKSFQAAVNLNPNHGRAWMGLGVVEQDSGDLNSAIQDYDHSVKAHPSDVAYLLLARALEQSGRNSEAQSAIQKAKLLSPNFEQAQREAAGLLSRRPSP